MKSYLTAIFFLLFGLSSTAFSGTTYTVGIVPQYEAEKLHRIWRPILDLLEQQTGERFELRGSYSISDFERQFASGDFDFAYMNPYHFVVANKQAGYIPLVKDTGKKLYGILVTRNDSSINSPTDLEGKKIAYPSPNALGASMMIRKELQETFGVTPSPLYVRSHDSVYLNVLLGKTAAGGGVQKTFNQQKPEYRKALKIIYQTTQINPHPFAALSSVPEDVRKKVTAAMIKLGNSEHGRELLAKIPIKQIGPATMQDYTPLLTMGLDRYYQGN